MGKNMNHMNTNHIRQTQIETQKLFLKTEQNKTPKLKLDKNP